MKRELPALANMICHLYTLLCNSDILHLIAHWIINSLFETNIQKKPMPNSTFAVGGVSYSADSFVVAEIFVQRIKICGKNPPIANLPTVRGKAEKTH